MVIYKLNAQGGHLCSCGPPNAITPEQVLRHHCFKRRGGMGRQALATPLSYLHFVFHIKVKGITLKDPRVFIMFA
jgi:hypothetical protein